MSKQLRQYYNFHKIVQFFMTQLCIWPRENTGLLYKLLPYLASLVCIFSVLKIIYFIICNISDIDRVSEGTTLVASITALSIKIVLLAYNRSDVYRLNSILINWFRKELADSKQRSILLSHLGTYYYPSVTMIACTAISIFVFVLHPVLSVLTQHLHHEETIVYDLNVPQKTPWDISHNGVLFCIEYILLSMLNYTILLSIAVDVFFAYYAFVITNLFKLLSYKFTNLAHDVKNQGELKSLIRQHQLLMSCKRNLETPFGPVILGLCITSAVTMCTIAYQLYQMKEIDVRLVVRESTHLFVKGVQAFMYSWYTNEITRASNELSDAVFTSDWSSVWNFGYMRNVLFILSLPPMTLSACGFFLVNISVFLNIMKGTISYFGLLRTFSE